MHPHRLPLRLNQLPNIITIHIQCTKWNHMDITVCKYQFHCNVHTYFEGWYISADAVKILGTRLHHIPHKWKWRSSEEILLAFYYFCFLVSIRAAAALHYCKCATTNNRLATLREFWNSSKRHFPIFQTWNLTKMKIFISWRLLLLQTRKMNYFLEWPTEI